MNKTKIDNYYKDYVFKIEDFKCSYNGNNVVLKINKLEIPRNKIIILLGISGAGKSTFLETLGLMNYTLNNDSKIYFYNNNEEINIGKLWKKNDCRTLSELRKKYFSFIFQNTNLMPNFTAFENISLTQMIDGCSKKDAIKKAENIANKLKLSINKNKKTFELSGGEKQRVAFIRAITSEFSILFGDEPTGNLDEINSNILMDFLQKKIKEEKKSAIIVTHNLKLALKYADQLILLEKIKIDDENFYGEISNDNIYTALYENNTKNWIDSNNNNVSNKIKIIIKKIIGNNN